MKIFYTISTIILWVCIGANLCCLIRNVRLNKCLSEAIQGLAEAKKRCDETAAKLDKALDELQKNGIAAALALFEEEEVSNGKL